MQRNLGWEANMTTTPISGDLHGINTIDVHALTKQGGSYSYNVRVWGGGNVHLKVEYYTGDQIALDADAIKGTWKTVEERIKIESDHTTSGSFTLPASVDKNGNERSYEMRVKFSRGALTKGSNYHFEMTG